MADTIDFEFTIKNLQEVNNGLIGIARKMNVKSEEKMEELAKKVRDRAQELCPVGPGKGAGHLRDAIEYLGEENDSFFVGIENYKDDYPYAAAIEFGHPLGRGEPQPYLRPALDEMARGKGLVRTGFDNILSELY